MHTATYRFAPPSAPLSGSTDCVLYLYRMPAGRPDWEVLLCRVRGPNAIECVREARRQVRILRRGGELR